MPNYITGSQFLLNYDARRVAELISDTGEPVPSGSVATNEVLVEMLNQAESMVNLATRVGDRYSIADLTTLAADPIDGGSLRRLVSDIAWGLICKRRGMSQSSIGDQAPGYQEAMQTLELLRLGERIFDFDGAAAAGLPSVQQLGVDSSCQMVNARRFFGCNAINRNTGYSTGGSGGCGGDC